MIRLMKIVQKNGAIIVSNGKDVMNDRVMNIVPYDPEEHDAEDVVDEEEQKEGGREMESGR